jgi:hypothetical protein
MLTAGRAVEIKRPLLFNQKKYIQQDSFTNDVDEGNTAREAS